MFTVPSSNAVVGYHRGLLILVAQGWLAPIFFSRSGYLTATTDSTGVKCIDSTRHATGWRIEGPSQCHVTTGGPSSGTVTGRMEREQQ